MTKIKDATYWSEQIRKGETTPIELLLVAEKKIEKLNPQYNALVAYDINQAKNDLSKTQNGYFAGLPFPLKMLGQDHANLPATACSKLFKDNIAHSDDNYVKAVLAAGLTPFGQTNAPEFGFKNISDAALYGNTRNVWNSAYYSGGSSGGAATSGALTISVRDTASFLAEMQRQQETDPYQAPLLDQNTLHHLTASDKPLNIAFSTATPIAGIDISETAKTALQKTVDFLKAQGHQLTEIAFPLDARPLIQTYYQMNAAETYTMLKPWETAQGRKIRLDDVEPLTYALLETGRKADAASYVQALNAWDGACATFDDKVFKHYDFLLTPTTAKTAPKIGETFITPELLEKMVDISRYDFSEQIDIIEQAFETFLTFSPYTFISNLTGQPALSLPVYLETETNLPQGIQLWGRKNSEILMLQLALQFENHHQLVLPDFYRD